MDELILEDKRYISTRRAGKENGYHSDYMGQLIRSGKVKGQKVGRSWYIEEESLAHYLGKPFTAPTPTSAARASAPTPKVAEDPIEEVVQESIEVVQEPVQEVRPTPVREAVEVQPTEEPAEERAVPIHLPFKKTQPQSGGLRYVADDEPLLPQVAITANGARDMEAQTFLPHHELKRPKFNIKALALTLVVAVALSALVTGASVMVVANTQVVDNTASMSYTLGQ
jgi:hypothetical protein